MRGSESGPISEDISFVLRKAARRIIPILFICYILAYLDRINVGFAKLQMQQDLGMSDSVYGTGAGIFFLGYFLFEVPANMILQRIGARVWLSSIMVLWGSISAANMLVHTATEFYLLRFALGVVEAGFFPGVILFLTFWFPCHYRTRTTAAFMSAIPLSGAIGGPISGWILGRMSTFGGLRGWQWLYLLEGLPSVVAGIVAFIVLEDRPATARWLSPAEREALKYSLAQDGSSKVGEGNGLRTMSDAFKSRAMWILAGAFFGFAAGSYAVGFWLPQLLKDRFTSDPVEIGWLSAVPWTIGAVAMIICGRRSDQSGQYRIYVVVAGLIGAIAFGISALPGQPKAVSLAALTIATAGVMVSISTFWALPTNLLSASAAASGIAWINSLGSLSGYLCPSVVGWIRDRTHSMTPALLMLSGCCLAASVGVLALRNTQSLVPVSGTSSPHEIGAF
jgi:MFS family permease